MAKAYLVHKAVEVDKCVTHVKKKLQQIGYLEDNYRAFAKYDGCCTVVKIDEDGTVEYLSRTGETANLHHLTATIQQLFGEIAQLNRGVVLFGEAWWPGRDQFPEISGAFRRHAGDTRLQLALNDAVTLLEFEVGVSGRSFEDRHRGLASAFKGVLNPANDAMPVFMAREYNASEYVTAKALAAALVERGGYDGLILRNPLSGWEKDHSGNDGAIIKVKHRVSIDVRCVGMQEGLGKQAGMVGALLSSWKGVPFAVGTGLTNTLREAIWLNRVPAVGLIMEVECLGFTPEGTPREPSFKGFRHDKLKADDE